MQIEAGEQQVDKLATPLLVEGAQLAEPARQVPAEREVQRALPVGDGECSFDLGAIGRARKELEDAIEVAAEQRLVLRRSEQLALARAQTRVPVGEVGRRRQHESWRLGLLCSAEEKPQRGLGIREPFLDGVSHHAILAAVPAPPRRPSRNVATISSSTPSSASRSAASRSSRGSTRSTVAAGSAARLSRSSARSTVG